MNFVYSLALAVALLLQNIPPTGIPATINGIFKTAQHGHILVDVEGGETMNMFVTHSTKYFRDGKPAKLSQFRHGDKVTVDAERDVLMNLVAVRVQTPQAAAPKTK